MSNKNDTNTKVVQERGGRVSMIRVSQNTNKQLDYLALLCEKSKQDIVTELVNERYTALYANILEAIAEFQPEQLTNNEA